MLALSASDDRADVKYFLDVGTFLGGHDSKHEFELGGPISVLTLPLRPVGVPLFFTVHAENSAGARTSVTCSLPTYDVTVPSGRLRAEFTLTSNPTTIKASVVVHEDSLITKVFVGVGFGKHIYGDQMVRWTETNLDKRGIEIDIGDDPHNFKTLLHFSELRDGQLIGSDPIKSFPNVLAVGDCARLCLDIDHCVSINYDFGASGTCELLKAIQGVHDQLSINGLFCHYERLNAGHSVEFAYTELNMEHNSLHFVNLDITNSLEYRNLINSEGILTDFTCPDAERFNITEEYLTTVDCKAVIPPDRPDLQRLCVGQNPTILNNRTIKDGDGSATLFNGMEPMKDLRFSRMNTYLAANWDGIHDNETGIRIYSLSFGRQICGEEIHPHHDPHRHFAHESNWNFRGVITGSPDTDVFPLQGGFYYATLRALNKVQYGGPLATTFCHSTPMVIDVTKPIFYEVFNIKYKEDSYLLTMEHNSTDPESDIKSNALCLGRRPRDCSLMAWHKYNYNPNISHVFQIPDGIPAWVRIRITNNVDLYSVGHANQAILVDFSPPIAGVVYDGPMLREDLQFTKDSNMICANWVNFFDPDTGITGYAMGVGTEKGSSDIAGLQLLDASTYNYCVKLNRSSELLHNHTYFVEIWALNGGINQRNVSQSSDGVLVDLTPPVAGEVADGNKKDFRDQSYSALKSTARCQWRNFYDPESNMREYSVQVLKKSYEESDWEVIKPWTNVTAETNNTGWNNFHLEHKDNVKAVVKGINGALNDIQQESNGFVVDLTPPYLDNFGDGAELQNDIDFQSSQTYLDVNFKFFDDESSVDHYKLQVYEFKHGSKIQFQPGNQGEWVSLADPFAESYHFDGLNLNQGHRYSVRVGAVNGAGLLAIHDTNGVTIDVTPPTLLWVRVGVLADEEEETYEGYVWQSDHAGVKVSWSAYDHESGISAINVTVGTSQGSSNVKPWTTIEGLMRDAYIHSLFNDTDIEQTPPSPVYYVSIKIRNGAGLWSDVSSSLPIIVVPEDKTGIVFDGVSESLTTEVDYQADIHTLTMNFNGFESSLHGIMAFDWAIGTTPEGEDVKPYMEHGITHVELEDVAGNGISSAGYAQASIDLIPEVKYYSTLRAITNAGTVLQSTSDGFTVDTSAPNVILKSISNRVVEGDSTLFRYDQGILDASWTYNDTQYNDVLIEDNIDFNWYMVGSFPRASNVHGVSYLPVTPNQDVALIAGEVTPISEGHPNIISVSVGNKAGLKKTVIGPAVVLDKSAPLAGSVTCSNFVQSHLKIKCTWSGFLDNESNIDKYLISLGSLPGNIDRLPPIELPGYLLEYEIEDENKIHAEILYATIIAVNGVGLNTSSFSAPIYVDDTPPTYGVVVEIGSTSRVDTTDDSLTVQMNTKGCETLEDCLKIDAECIETLTHISVAWTHFSDDESGIRQYEIAIGTSQGGAQLLPFFPIDAALNYYTVNMDLNGQRQVYVTVKGENNAGLSTSVSSNGVYISYLSQGLPPLSFVGVLDAHPSAHGDIQYQSDATTIGAMWDVTGDPCPATSFEWAIERTDGQIIQDYQDMYTNTHGENDQLELEVGSRYYSLVRVINAIGFSYTLRSDGVTVNSFPLLPGSVYDGGISGYDLSIQTSATHVTANWEGFGQLRQEVNVEDILKGNKGIGNVEKDSIQEVSYYRVALGTDRRWPETRDNVVPFTNVWLNTSVTFSDLNLIDGNAVYYFTVEAHSSSYATATVTSNGFFISLQGNVQAGEIQMPDYVNTDTFVDVQWSGFISKHDMMLYYIALSDKEDPAKEECALFVDGGAATEEQKDSLFNIETVSNTGISTYTRLDNLQLQLNGIYFVWVIGVDEAGECNMTYHRFTVDTTVPEDGAITGGPYFNMGLAFTRDRTSLTVSWKGFEDTESGIDTFNVTLEKLGLCSQPENSQHVESVIMNGNMTDYTFSNLSLEGSTKYAVSITATNRARLTKSARTSPVVFDGSVPIAGHVTEGINFTADVVWWGIPTAMKGSILHQVDQSADKCPAREISLRDEHWSALEKHVLQDPKGITWNLVHRAANIQKKNLTEDITIKISRDSKADVVFSAAYTRSADMYRGGAYELYIKSANGDGKAVTGVTFWDGPSEDLHIYHHLDVPSDSACDCCFYDVISPNCSCQCDKVLAEQQNQTDAFDAEVADSVPSQTSCGLQIYAGVDPSVVAWCRFFNTTNDDMAVSSELDFDPSEKFHNYKIVFDIIKEDLLETWCMRVYVDRRQAADLCGIPPLSTDTWLLLHVWNKDNYMPSLDVFDLWEGRAIFSRLVFPPAPGALCRSGDPFIAGTNAIVSYEVGIGTEMFSTDVEDFRQVLEPCIPCTDACSHIVCDPLCPTTGQHLLTFTLSDIFMSSEYNGSFYLTVKAVLGSGAEAIASSNGFFIDLSPPEFDKDVMIYIDVQQGDFTPVEFQSSRDTIKAVWLCTDDKNEIQEYEWAIGTSVGGDDIQEFQSTGLNSAGINSSLGGMLEHNTTYFVTVKCTNEAGLTTTFEAEIGVTVLLISPDLDQVNSSAVGAEHFMESVYPDTALQSHNPSACGESWTVSPDPSVDRYDFCIGSSKEVIDDIMPCVWVGYNTSGTAEIKDGKLWIDGQAFYNISKIRALSEGIYDTTQPEDDVNEFRMEVGRTLFLSLRVCNKATLCSVKLVNTIIITDDETILKSSRDGESIKVNVRPKQRRKKRSTDDIVVFIETPEGLELGQSLIVNELTEDQLQTTYTSSASTIFTPYIVNPNTTLNRTERALRGRVKELEMVFGISSVGQTEMPGSVKLTFNQTNMFPAPEDDIRMLIHWNTATGQWEISGSSCQQENDTVINNYIYNTTTVKVCHTHQMIVNDSANATYLSKETQFGIARASVSYMNEAPYLKGSTHYILNEDAGEQELFLEAIDPEEDPVVYSFSIVETNIGQVTIHQSGRVHVTVCDHCFGVVSIPVSLEDDPVLTDIPKATNYQNFTIEVVELNDPPSIHLFSPSGIQLLGLDKSEPVMIFVDETTQTKGITIGTIVVYDVDGKQNLSFIIDNNDNNGTFSDFEILETEALTMLNCLNAKCQGEAVIQDLDKMEVKGMTLNYTLNAEFHGIDEIKIVAKDENGTFSDVATIQVVVVIDKCQNGKCASINATQYTCSDVRRAESFDEYYYCDCGSSWKGLYCENDVDECLAYSPCEELEACRNMIGSYQCYCEDFLCEISLNAWQFSLVVVLPVLLVAVVIVIVVICIKKEEKRRRNEDYRVSSAMSRHKEFNYPDRTNLLQNRKFRNELTLSNHGDDWDIFGANENQAPPMHLFTKYNKVYPSEDEESLSVHSKDSVVGTGAKPKLPKSLAPIATTMSVNPSNKQSIALQTMKKPNMHQSEQPSILETKFSSNAGEAVSSNEVFRGLDKGKENEGFVAAEDECEYGFNKGEDRNENPMEGSDNDDDVVSITQFQSVPIKVQFEKNLPGMIPPIRLNGEQIPALGKSGFPDATLHPPPLRPTVQPPPRRLFETYRNNPNVFHPPPNSLTAELPPRRLFEAYKNDSDTFHPPPRNFTSTGEQNVLEDFEEEWESKA